MRVERKRHRHQRHARCERARSGGGIGTAPRAPRKDHAGQPAEQSDGAGFARHLQHDLVRVRGAGAARGVDEVVAWRGVGGIGIAETAHADAVERVRRRHAERGVPDAQAPGGGLVDRALGAAQDQQAALDAGTEALRVVPGEHADRTQRQHEGQHHAGELAPAARRAPARQQRHQHEREPRRARARQQHRRGKQQQRHQHAAQAEARPCRGQHERRQHRQYRAELEVAGAEDARHPLRLGDATQAVAGRHLHVGVDHPQQHDRRHRRGCHRPGGRITQGPAGKQREGEEAQGGRDRRPAAPRFHRIDG